MSSLLMLNLNTEVGALYVFWNISVTHIHTHTDLKLKRLFWFSDLRNVPYIQYLRVCENNKITLNRKFDHSVFDYKQKMFKKNWGGFFFDLTTVHFSYEEVGGEMLKTNLLKRKTVIRNFCSVREGVQNR